MQCFHFHTSAYIYELISHRSKLLTTLEVTIVVGETLTMLAVKPVYCYWPSLDMEGVANTLSGLYCVRGIY